MKTITIEVRRGIVHVKRQSKGTTLIVRDYDCQEDDEESGNNVKHDKKGYPHYEAKFVAKE